MTRVFVFQPKSDGRLSIWQVLLCGLCLWWAVPAAALDVSANSVHLQQSQLEQEQKRQISLSVKAIDMKSTLDISAVLQNLKAAELQYAATQLDVNNANLSLTQVIQTIQNAQKALQNDKEQAQELMFFSLNDNVREQQQSISLKIHNQQSIIQINQQRQDVLVKTLAILNRQLVEEKSQLNRLREVYAHQQKIVQQANIEKQVADLNIQQNSWLKKILSLNQLIETLSPQSHQYQVLAWQLFVAQENSNLLQIQISLTHDKIQLTTLTSDDINEDLSVTNLNQERQSLDDLADHLNQTSQLIISKQLLLNKRQRILHDQGMNNVDMDSDLSDIYQHYERYQTQVQTLEASIAQQKTINTERLAKALARRQGLPGFSWFEWYMLGQGLVQMEVMTYQAILGISRDVAVNVTQLSWLRIVRLCLGTLLMASFGYGMVRFINQRLQRYTAKAADLRSRFFIGIMRLLRCHLKLFLIFAWCLLCLTELSIGEQWLRVIFYLLLTGFVFNLAFSAARAGLYENISSDLGDDVRLYFKIFWTLVFGAAVTIGLVLSQQMNVMYEVQDFFNRLFTLFVLILASMLLKAWKVVPHLIIPYVNAKHFYLIRVIKLLGVLIPLIILSNALIGMVGYVELAWTISKYEGIFVCFVIAYLVLKGMLNEGLTWLADVLISHFRAGWLLTEAVLKPASKWLHVFFFIGMCYLLLYSYGLPQQDFFIKLYFQIMHVTLLRFSTTNITLWVLVKAALVALVFVWAVHWSREFCYRRLYIGVKDIGARNSLAIFTQYGIVLLGVLVTLKVLQIDLTVLAFIFSGFAIGIGFGLRDLANNFACGLLLLIERPMRRDDTVSIGSHDGVVRHIGMRAITLISPDNGEVVVPNSEAFSKIFINWTRQDDVVRCEVIVKVSREENPHYLQNVIKAAVAGTDGILDKPVPVVLLKSLQDTVLEFEVRFHINYRIYDSRTLMKSRVLFNIWRSFNSLGIKPPYPQQDIHIKEFPVGFK